MGGGDTGQGPQPGVRELRLRGGEESSPGPAGGRLGPRGDRAGARAPQGRARAGVPTSGRALVGGGRCAEVRARARVRARGDQEDGPARASCRPSLPRPPASSPRARGDPLSPRHMSSSSTPPQPARSSSAAAAGRAPRPPRAPPPPRPRARPGCALGRARAAAARGRRRRARPAREGPQLHPRRPTSSRSTYQPPCDVER